MIPITATVPSVYPITPLKMFINVISPILTPYIHRVSSRLSHRTNIQQYYHARK